MSIFQYRENKTRLLLMVMVFNGVFNIKDVSGISANPRRKRFQRYPLRRHYKNVHDLYEWEPLAELKLIDRHDPTRLFEQLNKETIVNKNVLPGLFGELDNNWDYIKSLNFNNKLKAVTAGQLQANRERDRENEMLHDLNESFLRAKTEKELQRQRERLENAASDREFESMLNGQREKSRGGLAVIHTFDTVEPLEPKINILSKAMKKPTPRPNLCPTKCSTTPRTCPSTTTKCSTTCRTTTPCPPPTQPTEICLPEPTRCSQNSPKRPAETKKKRPLIESTKAEQLLKIIRGMKRHALLMLKDLNYLELEILEKSSGSCPNHESRNEGQRSQSQKNRERLDLPGSKAKLKLKFHQNSKPTHQSQSFYFGVRPLEALEDLDEARDEELKLEQKVREEHQMLRQQLKAKENQWLQKAKRARFNEAPEAAARLETVYPKVIEHVKGMDEGQSNSNAPLSLKIQNVVAKPLVLPPNPSGELGSSASVETKTGLPKPISAPQSQIYSISDHKLMINEMTPQQIQPKISKPKKKKKKKQKILANVILRPERVPLEDRERIRFQEQKSPRNRRNRGRWRESINNNDM
ncbi:uncharacterized protein [Drosophila tropicalis]|uniref:uncharacterized protein n=1 Tax=Drosophila tropicalis TaxID=46794 RepID=UPI0035ABB961